MSSLDITHVTRLLNANKLYTLGSLMKIPYHKLEELQYCGPKNLAVLQCIYEEYSDTDPKTIKPIDKKVDLKEAIFSSAPGYDVIQKTRIYNTLAKNGITTMEELSKTPFEKVCDFRNIGTKGLNVINIVYDKYIRA